MPSYTSRCAHCGTEYDYVRKIADRSDTPVCCSRHTEKLIDAVACVDVWTGHKGFVGYSSKGKPQFIETAADRRKFMRDNRLLPADEGLREADIQRANQDRARDERRTKRVKEIVARL